MPLQPSMRSLQGLNMTCHKVTLYHRLLQVLARYLLKNAGQQEMMPPVVYLLVCVLTFAVLSHSVLASPCNNPLLPI